MRFSNFFCPTLRESPADASVVSHSLMLRAGMIFQTASGIYCWLPLAVKVMDKIVNIICREQEKIGACRVTLSTIQPAHLWVSSGRYDSYGPEMLKMKDRRGGEFLYSPTNEEQITDLFKSYVKSYNGLPLNLFQIHWKFRDEIRPRFGVMRGREFLMKDGYSFDLSREDAIVTYNKIFASYMKTFCAMGLTVVPVMADSGAIGGNMSHEFHILAENGESTLYYDKRLLVCDHYDEIKDFYAVSQDKYDQNSCPVKGCDLEISNGIEVGHIFYFGTKYSKSLDAFVIGSGGNKIYPEMGSYGIGVSRLIGAIIESCHDENGIIWPKEVAPFDVCLLNLNNKNESINNISEELYAQLSELCDVLYDDRGISAGQKLMDADLIGIPWQIIVGKNVKDGFIELKNRKTLEVQTVTIESAVSRIMENVL